MARRFGARLALDLLMKIPQSELSLWSWRTPKRAFYNFCRIHKTLKVTPAMAAMITDKLWSLEDNAERIDARQPEFAKRGPYKKRMAY